MIASGNTTIRNKKSRVVMASVSVLACPSTVCFGFLNCGTPTKQRLLQGIRSTEDSDGPLAELLTWRQSRRPRAPQSGSLSGRPEAQDVVACCLSDSLHGRDG